MSSLILILTSLGIFFTQDLEQKNKETIFLTEQGQKSYSEFQEDFEEKEIIIVKKDFEKIDTNIKNQFEKKLSLVKTKFLDLCHLVSKKSFPLKDNQLFKFESESHLAFLLICEQQPDLVKQKLIELQEQDYWNPGNKRVHYLGSTYTNLLLDRYSKKIKKILFPALFVGVFAFLFFLTKNLLHAIYLFIPCLSSASLALVTTKLIWAETNLINSVVPLILFVISMALSLHIYHCANEKEDLVRAIKHKIQPILLMLGTTFTGFFSLTFSKLTVIQDFGILTACLLLISFLINIIWFYFAARALKINFKTDENINTELPTYKVAIKPFSFITIGLISLMAVLSSIFVYPDIKTITDATLYFPKSSGFKQSIDNVANTVSGFPILEVIIKSKGELTLKEFENIYKMEKDLEKDLLHIDPSKKLFSLNMLVAKANQQYTSQEQLPTTDVAYATMAAQIPGQIQAGYPIFENQYRFTILGKTINVDQYNKILDLISGKLNQQNLNFSFDGLYYHLMVAQDQMITTLLKSFLISLLIISTFALIAFRSLKVFFIFLVVNIIPVCINFVLMRVFNFSFNIATIMTYSISLGLIVDSSFHIIHALSLKYSQSNYIKTIVRPVIQTNVILSLSFLCFFINDFLPIREFGVCLGMIIFTGLIFDLLVLPTLYRGNKNLFSRIKKEL